jgi:hypothetical protein
MPILTKASSAINIGFLKKFAAGKVDEEKKRQEELEADLARQASETVPNIVIDIPDPEPDSDEIDTDEWPDPRP